MQKNRGEKDKQAVHHNKKILRQQIESPGNSKTVFQASMLAQQLGPGDHAGAKPPLNALFISFGYEGGK